MDYMIKDLANPVSIYTDEDLVSRVTEDTKSDDPMSVKGYLTRKSKQAARALRLFALDQDKEVILERAKAAESGTAKRGTNLADFLCGKHVTNEEDCVTLDVIEYENQLLSV